MRTTSALIEKFRETLADRERVDAMLQALLWVRGREDWREAVHFLSGIIEGPLELDGVRHEDEMAVAKAMDSASNAVWFSIADLLDAELQAEAHYAAEQAMEERVEDVQPGPVRDTLWEWTLAGRPSDVRVDGLYTYEGFRDAAVSLIGSAIQLHISEVVGAELFRERLTDAQYRAITWPVYEPTLYTSEES